MACIKNIARFAINSTDNVNSALYSTLLQYGLYLYTFNINRDTTIDFTTPGLFSGLLGRIGTLGTGEAYGWKILMAVRFGNSTVYNIDFSANVKWRGGLAPSFTSSNKTYYISLEFTADDVNSLPDIRGAFLGSF